MGRLLFTTVCLVVAALPAGAADQADPLAEARSLYNQRNFEAAVSAAERARLILTNADRADLIAARAYLERFRERDAADDLTNARLRLARLDPRRFTPRERIEFIVGLGEALYLDQSYGAAANLFASALDAVDGPTPDARERVLDWWANALDRVAQPRQDTERQEIYDRVWKRMRTELAAHPGSATAAYWLAAAARGRGDLQAAWEAAEAGWARAPLASDRGESLRADLDRLMLRGILPERAKALAQPAETLRAVWERFKEKWQKD